MAFYGLAYGQFPYLVVDKITIWRDATAPESLRTIFVGAAVVLPVIIGYTVVSYRGFSGKARALSYTN
jgi:cytochrome bd ubiquinol oxidase subunit II